jgi:murein tripeptide amidase MpaA
VRSARPVGVSPLASRDDDETRRLLDETVLLLDPMLNPDGRDALAHENHRSIGREPAPSCRCWSTPTASTSHPKDRRKLRAGEGRGFFFGRSPPSEVIP